MNILKLANERTTIPRVITGVVTAAAIGLGTFFWETLKELVPPSVLWTALATSVVLLMFQFLWKRPNRPPAQGELGLKKMWRHEAALEQGEGRTFAALCQSLLERADQDDTVRILGIDWDELFHDSRTLERFLEKLRFEVILSDPEAPMLIEKRACEMSWKSPVDQTALYPEGTGEHSLLRIREKVRPNKNVADSFQQRHAGRFELKLSSTLPTVSILMTSKEAVGVLHAHPWKVKESVIYHCVECERTPAVTNARERAYGTSMYGFMRGIFDAAWQAPGWHTVEINSRAEAANRESGPRLASLG
jgi:hypothetical protein